jgi:hypothetical protein
LRFGRKGWLAVILCAVVGVGAFAGLHFYRHRFVRSDEDLLRLLPRNNATLFFANIAALRQAGYLRLLENTQQAQDKDYADFVQQTRFDYTKDLDALAGASEDSQHLFFALRGRFRWDEICSYVKTQGGACKGSAGKMATSTPGRWASFHSLQPDVITVAIGNLTTRDEQIQVQKAAASPSSAPVWLRPAHALLANPSELPLTLRIFAISFQSADSVIFALQPVVSNGVAFEIAIDAVFQNNSMADTARKQLVLNTNMLKLELSREQKQADPADLAWLLTSGTFEVRNQHLVGTWPVRQELVHSLE